MVLNLAPARERLAERKKSGDFFAKKSLGQNFLVNDGVLNKIFKKVAIIQPPQIVEIGPGLGALTDGLRLLQPQLVLLELDQRFAEYWREQNLAVIEVDALQYDWRQLNQPYVLVSNLPYQIAASIVIERCIDPKPLCTHMVLMFQKEVAQRLRAPHLDSNYGFLSVMAQTFFKMETVSEAGPGDFDPPPKIASRVLAFERLAVNITDPSGYLRFIKSAFLHPRKKVANNWQEGLALSKEQVQDLLLSEKLSESARPHEISIKQFQSLFARYLLNKSY
jgi:16S rRNA (adenine1518-N6/adenine1519-N6)-dimethyltransferase